MNRQEFDRYCRGTFAEKLRRAWAGLCPCCGIGKFFERWAKPAKHCPHCGWISQQEQGACTGAMYLSATVTEIFTIAVFLPMYLLGFDYKTMFLAGLPIVVMFGLWFFPLSKALWAAMDFWTDLQSGHFEEGDYLRQSFRQAEETSNT